MSEMANRVAKAMADGLGKRGVFLIGRDWYEVVYEIIGAMREPTAEMLKTCGDHWLTQYDCDSGYLLEDDAAHNWNLMIDAALTRPQT